MALQDRIGGDRPVFSEAELALLKMPPIPLRVPTDDQKTDTDSDADSKEPAKAFVSKELHNFAMTHRDPDVCPPMDTPTVASQRYNEVRGYMLGRMAEEAGLDDESVEVYEMEDKGQKENIDGDASDEKRGERSEITSEDDGSESDRDDIYGEGDDQSRGLFTEIPDVLEPKEIEPLVMLIRNCIVDQLAGELTDTGESLQRVRCRLLVATENGRNLLREMLVYVDVWQLEEASVYFMILRQIVEAILANQLMEFTWHAMRL
jgi:hypothetical protein